MEIVASYQEKETVLLSKIEKIEDDLKRKIVIDQRLENIERRISLQEQYSRRECIEIVNIPILDDDNKLEEVVVDLFKEAGVDVDANDFHAIHRLKNKPTIIAKLVNRRNAIKILKQKKTVREFSDAKKKKFSAKGKIYINESLCPTYKKLYGICNSLFKANKISSFYVINGSINVKLAEGAAGGGITSISHLNDLYNLFGVECIDDINSKHFESRTKDK